ncbi:hypothetical protein Tco_1172002 [Tanacetum coccineum]
MVTGMVIRHSKANILRGVPFDETRRKVINGLAVQLPPSYSSIIIEAWSMTNGREDTPPLSFLTLTPLPGPNVGELPPITDFTFTTKSPENTPLTNRASTLGNPNPMISTAFVEAKNEVLKSILRDRRRQVHNEDLRTKLDYYSGEYDEEREMELRPVCARETTYVLQTRSPRAQIHMGRVVEFEDAPNMNGSRVERESNERRPSERRVEEGGSRRGNLPPPLATHLGRSENEQPLDSIACVTPFVCWIEDYLVLDRLKVISHVGSYDGMGDPDNYLHFFEGVIRMQKWAMPVACHMFTYTSYTLKDSTRIW